MKVGGGLGFEGTLSRVSLEGVGLWQGLRVSFPGKKSIFR